MSKTMNLQVPKPGNESRNQHLRIRSEGARAYCHINQRPAKTRHTQGRRRSSMHAAGTLVSLPPLRVWSMGMWAGVGRVRQGRAGQGKARQGNYNRFFHTPTHTRLRLRLSSPSMLPPQSLCIAVRTALKTLHINDFDESSKTGRLSLSLFPSHTFSPCCRFAHLASPSPRTAARQPPAVLTWSLAIYMYI